MCFSLFLYSGHDGHGHFGQNDFLFRGVAGDACGGYAAGSYFAFFFTTRRTVFTTFLAGAGLGA